MINEAVTREIPEKESKLRQEQEAAFFKERKELITQQNGVKRAQIVAIMQRFPLEKAIQEVGVKMIKRIDNTTDEEIQELEKEKESPYKTKRYHYNYKMPEELTEENLQRTFINVASTAHFQNKDKTVRPEHFNLD